MVSFGNRDSGSVIRASHPWRQITRYQHRSSRSLHGRRGIPLPWGATSLASRSIQLFGPVGSDRVGSAVTVRSHPEAPTHDSRITEKSPISREEGARAGSVRDETPDPDGGPRCGVDDRSADRRAQRRRRSSPGFRLVPFQRRNTGEREERRTRTRTRQQKKREPEPLLIERGSDDDLPPYHDSISIAGTIPDESIIMTTTTTTTTTTSPGFSFRFAVKTRTN